VVVSLVPPEYLDVPVYRIWLAKAQEMGRIKPCTRSGFAPALWIRSAPDPHCRHHGLSVRSALKRALREAKRQPEIIDWCSSNERFHLMNGHAEPKDSDVSPAIATGPTTSGEEVRLSYLSKRLVLGDIEDELPEIVKLVDAYLETVERERLLSAAT
jgi:hypothetical protein